MKNIWIVTTGSSDVQLKTEDNWRTLHRKVRSNLETNKQFSPVTSEQTGEKRWLYPARAVGRVYSPALDEHYADLDFPLLTPFVKYLKEKEVPLDRIVVILTDQSEVVESADKKDPSRPFWQDTCTLEPILQKFLQSHFSKESLKLDFLTLKPESGAVGLDDWNEVLNLVQGQLNHLYIPDDATVYVSHQAGTPAISSAVQFESLALFGKRVKFLVSNEQNPELTRFIDRSSYLKRIRKQEALALLNNYDYSGVYQLLKEDLRESKREEDQQILQRLEMAMLWNFAKFQEVLEDWFQVSPEDAEDWWGKNWWRQGFESAFLAKVRFQQGNIVEAFIHAYRSVEGSLSKWGKQRFFDHVTMYNDRAWLQPSILEDANDYFKKAKFKEKDGSPKNTLAKLKVKLIDLAERIQQTPEKDEAKRGLLLDGEDLNILFRATRTNYKQAGFDLFWDAKKGIKEKRNKNVHQLEGLAEEDFFRDWEVENLEAWERRMLTYLNFIAEDDLPEGVAFASLEDASVMASLHEEIVSAINN